MTDKKEVLFVDQHDHSIYRVEIDESNFETNIYLEYSEIDPKWTSLCKGKTAMSLHDDGNGVTIRDGMDPSKKVRLDYSEVAGFIMLFKALNELSSKSSIASDIAVY